MNFTILDVHINGMALKGDDKPLTAGDKVERKPRGPAPCWAWPGEKLLGPRKQGGKSHHKLRETQHIHTHTHFFFFLKKTAQSHRPVKADLSNHHPSL